MRIITPNKEPYHPIQSVLDHFLLTNAAENIASGVNEKWRDRKFSEVTVSGSSGSSPSPTLACS
ncbi:MAG: hypothetical protein VYC11_06175 [Candidatus Thermoplasmatota archaeon]|nr:hypothetical protein [Candidatus Thermoplasmatota archaeon]